MNKRRKKLAYNRKGSLSREHKRRQSQTTKRGSPNNHFMSVSNSIDNIPPFLSAMLVEYKPTDGFPHIRHYIVSRYTIH